MYEHETLPAPSQNTPFPGLNLKVGKTVWTKWTLTGQSVWKVGKTFLEVGTKRIYSSLNMNIRLSLFWSTWSGAMSQDTATCVGLADECDYCYCRALEQKSQKVLALLFPWIVKNTWKQGPTARVFLILHPPACFRRQLKVLTAKAMAKLLGQLSCTALEGLMGKYKYRTLQSHIRYSVNSCVDFLTMGHCAVCLNNLLQVKRMQQGPVAKLIGNIKQRKQACPDNN